MIAAPALPGTIPTLGPALLGIGRSRSAITWTACQPFMASVVVANRTGPILPSAVLATAIPREKQHFVYSVAVHRPGLHLGSLGWRQTGKLCLLQCSRLELGIEAPAAP